MKLLHVLLPYRFTLFSNERSNGKSSYRVLLPYRFTLFSNGITFGKLSAFVLLPYRFTLFSNKSNRFIVLFCGFTTLQIYTILKPVDFPEHNQKCFTTLQIYTILKLFDLSRRRYSRFTTLQIYTILKPLNPGGQSHGVLLPYRFTLFSNTVLCLDIVNGFYYLIDLHYSQTHFLFYIYP